ncbi:MAG: hypothetical protein IAE78_27975 [Myxococcus sp.]|nr:hypothetical protein [Myxococcus sp.]
MRAMTMAGLLVMGCGVPMDGGLPDGGQVLIPSAGGAGTPATRAGLLSFAQGGAYLSWKAEPMVHTSSGPHGSVRTFVNDALYASLKAGNATHPNGSVSVKELYANGARTGWAVDAKGDDGVWVYFEGFEPQLNQYFFRGTGNLCANCHASGVDFVLTPASALP